MNTIQTTSGKQIEFTASKQDEFDAYLEEQYEAAYQMLVDKNRQLDEVFAQNRILEARNIRLSAEVGRLVGALKNLKFFAVDDNTFEQDLYDEYDNKLAEMKDYMIEKIDLFLKFKSSEWYKECLKQVIADPSTKPDLRKIAESASDMIDKALMNAFN